MARDPLAAWVRQARARRRVGVDARCGCGESREYRLIKGREPPTCFACDRIAQGREAFEVQHVFGQNNGPETLLVPINDHRAVLSVEQYAWPPKTLRNPNGSPLLRAAGYLRGLSETIRYLLDQCEWIADFLERLDTMLEKRLGRFWWRRSAVSEFAVTPKKGKP